MQKNILDLAKDLDFETEDEYFNYIIESKINWNKSQFRRLLADIQLVEWGTKAFLLYLDNMGIVVDKETIEWLINI